MKRGLTMKRILWMGFIVSCGAALFGAGNGGSAVGFLSLPVGARSASLGEGGLALIRDASALHINPAAMAGLGNASIVGTHGAYIDGTSVDHVSYVQPKTNWGAMGVGFQYFSAGTIDGTDTSGNPLEGFSPKDMALTVGYARGVGAINMGAAVKYVDSQLVDSANTLSVDLGLASKPLLDGRLVLGVAGQNLTGSLKYEQEEDDLPRTIKAGAGYALTPDWDLALDADFPAGDESSYGVGTEYRVKPTEAWGLALRGGYSTRTSEVDGFTGFTMGLGASRKSLSVDYAFVPVGDVGSTHWVTLGWRTR
jgi:hypothetical protein